MKNINNLYATKQLIKIRKSQKISQPEMADLLTVLTGDKISASLYQKWEQGSLGVTPSKALSIAKALETSVKDIWTTKKNVK